MFQGLRTTISAALLSLALAGTATAQGGPPPRLDLTLTPRAEALDVRMRLPAPDLDAGEGLVRLPLSLVGIPSARYDGQALQARDDLGPIPLRQAEEPPTPQGTYRRWLVERPTRGDVIVSYSAPPRAVTAATNNGPLFDLRQESGGFIGAGVGFLAAPVAPGPWSVRLAWDLSEAPAGSRGAWTYGDGTVETVLPSQALAFSYYAGGPLGVFPADGDGGFHMYWLTKPPFDPAELADKTRRLYDHMSAFFGDPPGAPYRVFMRANPYDGVGGTALGRSFSFGYNPTDKPTVESLLSLVSHEVAHTWPSMAGEHGETAWYSEGMAEFYSLVLSWRAGVTPLDQVVETMNSRADTYYANPHIALTNAQAAEIFWSDPVAQTVPYGRGWMYLLQTDAEIRQASSGARSLDDIVKAIRKAQLAGAPYGVPLWLSLVGAEIGEDKAQAQFDAMAAGRRLSPPSGLYAPCLKVVPRQVRTFELGFPRAVLNEDRIVSGLVPDSAAAQAGLRDGDQITDVRDLNVARKDQGQTITLTVERDGAALTLTYLPRGQTVEAWGWARDAAAPDSACRF
ncbi:hypothetical protein [Phenylobacterium sp.]|uniref:hypothetical protein n=1 Tax=Phenylobacterium sp. TaxID=1871053 RepID=UPI0027303F63|nr:hypothetical protein [Phenylobacterium sp.]MDP2215172.1 hypothetical protein [Phenylobacterium sp.]